LSANDGCCDLGENALGDTADGLGGLAEPALLLRIVGLSGGLLEGLHERFGGVVGGPESDRSAAAFGEAGDDYFEHTSGGGERLTGQVRRNQRKSGVDPVADGEVVELVEVCGLDDVLAFVESSGGGYEERQITAGPAIGQAVGHGLLFSGQLAVAEESAVTAEQRPPWPALVRSRAPLGAHGRGFAAWLFALELERTLPVRLDSLAGSASPELLAQARAALADLREAGCQWQAWRTAADGTAAIKSAVMPTDSRHDDISTGEAAAMLGVKPRRVRQLIDAAQLEGRLLGGRWLVSRQSVDMLREARRAS
jgi:hypothetical protein